MFTRTGSPSTSICGAAATLLADGRVLFAGGSGPGTWGDGRVYFSSVEVYDPATGGFRSAGSLSVARNGATATLLADGRVLVVGGVDQHGYLSSAEVTRAKP
jgi:N-acetylneuraminic acid mutarotase